MSRSTIQQGSSDSAQELGDESFMSAAELRNYVTQTEMAKASKDVGSDLAEKARAGTHQVIDATSRSYARKDCRGKAAGARPTKVRCGKGRQGSSGHAFSECVVHGQGPRAQ